MPSHPDRVRANYVSSNKPTLEDAFKAGYHCLWIKSEKRYIFDSLMKPGDPDGAFRAWQEGLDKSPSE